MWLTWFLRCLIPYLFLTILLTLVSCVKLNPRDSNTTLYGKKAVFMNTAPVVIFSSFFVYSVQVSMFTLLMGQIFSKRK